jgi:hypothetical protein
MLVLSMFAAHIGFVIETSWFSFLFVDLIPGNRKPIMYALTSLASLCVPLDVFHSQSLQLQ